MATFYEDYEITPFRPIPKTKEAVKRESALLGIGGNYLGALTR
jgi:hypothetical protein